RSSRTASSATRSRRSCATSTRSTGAENSTADPWSGWPSSAPSAGVRPSYLPVLTYWMQSPWFLNDEPSARVRSIQPPFLHLSLSLGGFPPPPPAVVASKWTLLTVQRPTSSATTNGTSVLL